MIPLMRLPRLYCKLGRDPWLLTPCTRVTRGDWCHAHHVGGQVRFTCINAASSKMCTSLHSAQHTLCIELYMKTHSEIAHQYGAFKIFLMMMSGEMGQYS